jgi:hypothetical protein
VLILSFNQQIEMNKLLFPNGGLPLYSDDFDYMQSSLRDGINACLYPYAEQTGGFMVVSGCYIAFNNTTQTYVVGAGWVLIQFELLYFAGGDSGITDETNLGTIELERHVYEDASPNATRNLVNGNSANVWQRREARFKQTPNNNAILYVAKNEYKLPYLIAKLIEGAADTQVGLTGFLNNWGGGNIILPKAIRRGNTVILRGLLEVGTIDLTIYTQAFTLQENYRPKVRQYFTCAMPDTGIALVDIFTDGSVYVKYLLDSPQTPPVLMDISSIRFEGA